jgi:hypothetical protein
MDNISHPKSRMYLTLTTSFSPCSAVVGICGASFFFLVQQKDHESHSAMRAESGVALSGCLQSLLGDQRLDITEHDI